MDNNRRLALAIALVILVIVATQLLFPPPTTRVAAGTTPAPAAATTPGAATPAPAAAPAALDTVAPTAPAAGAPTIGAATTPAVGAVPAETTLVAGTRAAFRVSSLGGSLVGAEMRTFRALTPAGEGRPVELAPRGEPLLSYRIVVPGDTLVLARTPMRMTRSGNTVRFEGTASGRLVQNVAVALVYGFAPDSFQLRVQGSVQNVSGPAFLLVDMPATLAASERDTLDHFNQLAYAWKPPTTTRAASPSASWIRASASWSRARSPGRWPRASTSCSACWRPADSASTSSR
jgi:hypothetical protein